MSELRLMAVHAHPDDESSKGAATMARYAAEGARVLVVTLTGGERGDILNPAMDLPEVHGRIPEIRRDEMAKAAAILGVEHHWLGFVDSGLPEGDPLPPLPEGCFALVPLEEPTEALVRVIREFRPHVLTTYDENGGYPHPDHIRCHEVSVAAYEAAGDSGCSRTPASRGRCRSCTTTTASCGSACSCSRTSSPSTAGGAVRASGSSTGTPSTASSTTRVTTQIECAKYFPQRDDALRAHATQIDPNGAFFARADRMAAAALADRGVRAGALPGARSTCRRPTCSPGSRRTDDRHPDCSVDRRCWPTTQPRDTGPEFGKASPFGLVVVVLLLVGTFLLVWSMNKHLRSCRSPSTPSTPNPTRPPTRAPSDARRRRDRR